MKFSFLVFVFLYFSCHVLHAQTDAYTSRDTAFFEHFVADTLGGKVTITQDIAIENLVLKDIELNEKVNGIPGGYRIQIISLSGRNAREETSVAKEQFLDLYPDFDYQQIYTLYQPPFFKVRVGNYRNKFEALKFYKDVLKHFPNAYLVKSHIEYPPIEE